MKRKGSKAQQPEDPNSVDEEMEENGGASEDVDVDENDESEDEPYEKKRRSSKSNKKNVSFSKKGSENDEEVTKKSKKKKSKKSKDIKNDDDEDSEADQDEEDETQYEVEKVLDEKMIKGVRHYLIRWKGYEEESDTWEPEDTLNCPELIEGFKENKKKSSKSGSKTKKASAKKQKDSSNEQEWDENEDFEVEKILDVYYRKNGKKEFLVVWKGYGPKESSWEPEENMNCKDLIARFMEKVETAKKFEGKELRANRKHVQRLTYNTPDSNRRLSKRNSGKERVQYHDAE